MTEFRRIRNQLEAERTIERFRVLLQRGDDVRRDRVESLRSRINSGEYVNEMKLSIAIDRLLDDWFASAAAEA